MLETRENGVTAGGRHFGVRARLPRKRRKKRKLKRMTKSCIVSLRILTSVLRLGICIQAFGKVEGKFELSFPTNGSVGRPCRSIQVRASLAGHAVASTVQGWPQSPRHLPLGQRRAHRGAPSLLAVLERFSPRLSRSAMPLRRGSRATARAIRSYNRPRPLKMASTPRHRSSWRCQHCVRMGRQPTGLASLPTRWARCCTRAPALFPRRRPPASRARRRRRRRSTRSTRSSSSSSSTSTTSTSTSSRSLSRHRQRRRSSQRCNKTRRRCRCSSCFSHSRCGNSSGSSLSNHGSRSSSRASTL